MVRKTITSSRNNKARVFFNNLEQTALDLYLSKVLYASLVAMVFSSPFLAILSILKLSGKNNLSLMVMSFFLTQNITSN